jgi:hypothetical protein
MQNIKKSVIILIILIIGISLAVFMSRPRPLPTTTEIENNPVSTSNETPAKTGTTVVAAKKSPYDTKNATLVFDGRQIKLVNGYALVTAADPSNNETLQYVGYESVGDLNQDKKPDVAFVITRQNKNAGPFYYVVAAVSSEEDYKTVYKATNLFLFGDRITPQSTAINSSARELQVNFLQRKQNDLPTAKPSIPVALMLKIGSTGKLEGLMK